MNILVVGGGHGMGSQLAFWFKAKGHTVWTISSQMNIDVEEKWYFAKDDDPGDSISIVKDFITNEIKLDGIIFANTFRQKDPHMFDPFLSKQHFMINVWIPMLLYSHLLEFNCIEENAGIVFLRDSLDSVSDDREFLSYSLSQQAISNLINTLLDTDRVNHRINILEISSESDPGYIAERVDMLVTGELKGSGRSFK